MRGGIGEEDVQYPRWLYCNCAPNLRRYRILAVAKKALDAQMLADHLKNSSTCPRRL